jgi:hypothetical protein
MMCTWPSGQHNYNRGTCTRCGLTENTVSVDEDFVPRITVPDTFDRVTVIVALRSQIESLSGNIEHGERHGWTESLLSMFRDDRDRAVELLALLTPTAPSTPF